MVAEWMGWDGIGYMDDVVPYMVSPSIAHVSIRVQRGRWREEDGERSKSNIMLMIIFFH